MIQIWIISPRTRTHIVWFTVMNILHSLCHRVKCARNIFGSIGIIVITEVLIERILQYKTISLVYFIYT